MAWHSVRHDEDEDAVRIPLSARQLIHIYGIFAFSRHHFVM